MNKFAIGVDYGTLSGRALLVDLDTGEEVATAVKRYAHGVMDTALPGGRKLGQDWALAASRGLSGGISGNHPGRTAAGGGIPGAGHRGGNRFYRLHHTAR